MTLKEERELKKAAKLEAEKQRIEAMREYEEMYDTFSSLSVIAFLSGILIKVFQVRLYQSFLL